MEDDTVKDLQMAVSKSEEKLVEAAEFGKMLLEQTEELKDEMDHLRAEYDKKLELAQQECHTLGMKLEQKCSMEKWYNEEIGHLKQEIADRQDHLKETMEMNNQMEVAKLNRQINELRTDLDSQTSKECQLKQTIAELESLVKERLNQSVTDIASRSSGSSEEITILHEEIANLQAQVTSLQSQLIEQRSEIGSATTEIENLRAKVLARDEELEDMKCQFTSVNNVLEQTRVEKMDLKCELDVLHMENNSHRKKGNSLFSELDDRRIDAEKQLISLQVSNQTLTEKYNVEKQQNSRYKRQISQLLLQLSSGMMDSEYVANLEGKLSQARQEIRTLLEEREKPATYKLQSDDAMCGQAETKIPDSEYTRYLVTVIEGKEEELKSLRKDLSCQRLQILDLKSRGSTHDARIVRLEGEKDKLRSQFMKLHAKTEELRLKYEPETIKKAGALVVKRTEKLSLFDAENVTITETCSADVSINQSQKQTSTHMLTQLQPLHTSQPHMQNINKKSTKTSLTNLVKSKTVSISDEIEECEIENVEDNSIDKCSEAIGSVGGEIKRKGRKITAMKHVSMPDSNVNDCKSS